MADPVPLRESLLRLWIAFRLERNYAITWPFLTVGGEQRPSSAQPRTATCDWYAFGAMQTWRTERR